MKAASAAKAGTMEQARQPLRIGLSLWATATAIFVASIVWLGAPAVLDPGSADFIPFPAALALFFAVFGTIHLGQGVFAKWRFSRYGASTLEAGPAVLGKVYRGKIRTDRPLQVSGPYTIRLLCESRDIRDRDGDSTKRTVRVPVWVASVQAPASANSAFGIPFEFKVPADGLPNRHGSSVAGYEIYWTLQISAPVRGLQYRAAFPLDVAAIESRSEDSEEEEERELAAARRHASLEDAFANQAKPESSRARALHYLIPTIGVLIFAAGSYSTWNQYAYGLGGVALSGRISAISAPSLDVALASGEVARIPRVTNYNTWTLGQIVELTCPRDVGSSRPCRMNTGSDRWIDALGTLAVGTAFLLFGAWLWPRRTGRRTSRQSLPG